MSIRPSAFHAPFVFAAVCVICTSGCAKQPEKSADRDAGRTTGTTARADAAPGHPPVRAAASAVPPVGGTALLPKGPTEADYPHLHNLLQVSKNIYTGGEPKHDEAFAALAKLGIKTVVSVDGAEPNVETARAHGLRYVHIPIGYDGVSEDAGKSLARLVRDADGPFYIHCHHGTHRGPAAAAVACVAAGQGTGKDALAVLERAGTSRNYAGLWRDVEAYHAPPSNAELPPLVAVAKVESLAAAMAKIDRASDNLKLCAQAEWQTPTDHPDIVPAQEALLLMEGFRESVRLQTEGYDKQFAQWMNESEMAAAALESATSNGDRSAAERHLALIQQQCKRCHVEYRD